MSVFLSLKVENIRSYRDETEFSLLASRLTSDAVRRDVTTTGDRVTGVLPVAGVFGANASGKTTLLRALSDLRSLVLGSFRFASVGQGIVRRPFLLDKQCADRPSSFQVELILDGVRWQYGVEVDDEQVIEEYAYHYPNGRAALVFERDADEVKYGASLTGYKKAFGPLIRSNSLLLSVSGAAADNPLTALFSWFDRNLLLADTSTRGLRAMRTAELLEDPEYRGRVLGLLQAADLGISGMQRLSPDPDFVESVNQAFGMMRNAIHGDDDTGAANSLVVGDLLRMEHDGPDGAVAFDDDDESLGTLVWAGLIGPLLDVIDGGHVLLADELDASLHPYLVRAVIKLFQRPDTNPHGAQLIFNAHDTSVLGDSSTEPLLGRDQIWFTTKFGDGTTQLEPLSNFKPRKDEAIERRYMQGRFGGVPIISDAEFKAALDWTEEVNA